MLFRSQHGEHRNAARYYKYQGIMQGGWLGATAIGNQLLVIGAILYESIPIWMTWTVFVVACCISMFTMLFMLKWLEKVAK